MLGKRTAIAHHIEYLARYCSRTKIPFDKIILMSPGDVRVDNLGATTPVEFRTVGRGWAPLLWEQCVLPRAAKGAAVLFCEYNCPLAYPGRVVVANHGIYESLPNTFSWWQRVRTTPLNRRSALRADRVIANSVCTKTDLIKYFGLPDSKIDVIYPGPADLFFEPHNQQSVEAEVVKAFGAKVPYVIFVGKLSKRRHVPNLIEAFGIVRQQQNLPHHLLIVGPNVTGLPLDELAAKHGLSRAMKYYPHLEQTVLAKLYAGADLFVLPSIYEGISWTMFEAMASGTAVLTVDHPTLAEGAAGAVLSVPTPEVEDLVRGMSALLADESLRRDYQRKGLAVAKKFSLSEGMQATIAVLDGVASPSDQRSLGHDAKA